MTIEQQLHTIGTIKELSTYQQQLRSKIQDYEAQVQNHHSWEKQPQTIEMKTMALVLKSSPVQERLSNFQEELWKKEQHKQAELAAKYQASSKPRRGMRR